MYKSIQQRRKARPSLHIFRDRERERDNNVCNRVTNCFRERVILVFITRVYTLCYFLHDTTNPYMTIKTTIFTHRPRVSLARFSFCWWRHNRLLMTSQWPDNCDTITWIVISNSLDIEFIYGDIHGRSCKKHISISWEAFKCVLSMAVVQLRDGIWNLAVSLPFLSNVLISCL